MPTGNGQSHPQRLIGKKEYELVGGGTDLKEHLGHKIEVKGKEMPAKAAEKAEKPGKATEEMGREGAHEHLQVSSMRHLAANCP